ncbi:hypothetical protein [uncultured Nostoc sp.]|uniref:BP74-related protein n=1 Tax=uncultured Nostoc sp. TaxID=340711 RepID=UPI0035CBB934
MKITQIGRRLISVFLMLVVGLIFLTSPASAATDTEAYFAFQTSPNDSFTIKLTDPNKIQKARDILSGKETNETHILGKIKKSKAPYNQNWDYQLDPSTIGFFSYAIEVCDASTPYLQDHLDEAGGAFLPGAIWCPWSSQLVKEISIN